MNDVTQLRPVNDQANRDVVALLESILAEARRGRILAVTIAANTKGRQSIGVAHAGEVDIANHVYALEMLRLALLTGEPIAYSEEF